MYKNLVSFDFKDNRPVRKPTKVRARYIPANNDPTYYDQKSIVDKRVVGTPIDNTCTYANVKSRHMKKNVKYYPLKNALPYVPIETTMRERVAINLFDPLQSNLNFAFKQIKQPKDSLVQEHHLGKVLRMTQKLNKNAVINERDIERQFIDNDNVGLQDKYFIEDRPHDLVKHRNDRTKNGLVNYNTMENTEKIYKLIKEHLTKKDNMANPNDMNR